MTVPATPRSGVECKTVREILPPWQVLQDKFQPKTAAAVPRNEALNQDAQQALEAQERANAMWAPPVAPPSSGPSSSGSSPEDSLVPTSGVRMSEPGPVAADVRDAASFDGTPGESNLTFKVYTVADLERRSDAPVSMRGSRANFDLTSSRGSQHWQRAYTALRAFGAAALEWFRIKGQRPNPKLALRIPFDNLGDELQVAVESIDWKKLGVTTGIVVGATLTLLFAVLTAAELTDDLKPPGAAAHLASSDTAGVPAQSALDSRSVAPATNMAAMGVQPVAPIVIAPAAVSNPDAPATSIGDIDGDAPAPAAKKHAARKAAAKPKATKLALRNAPF